jgi:hypothetical protein
MDLNQLQLWAKQQRAFEKEILHQQEIDRYIQYVLIISVMTAIVTLLIISY